MVGNRYCEGKGVPQDNAEAVRWWKRAADQGDAGAQNSLGVAYFTGKGVSQNYAEAYFWENLAAALGKGGTDKSVASARDQAAAKLSPATLSATQKRCRQWLEAFEKRRAQK
jgi:TPR repeat protein